MNKAIKQYFRSGAISMAPMLSLKDITQAAPKQVFPLFGDTDNVLETFNGSAALYQVAKALGVRQGDVILMPAYCCGAELGPFSHLACRFEFFDVDENLQFDMDQIERLLQQNNNVKAVLITHYFGFAQSQLDALFDRCEQQGIALIEDCAHSLFSLGEEKALGSVGHFAIFSPRKSLPMTEGGLVVINHSTFDGTQSQLHRPASIPRIQRLVYSIQHHFRARQAGDKMLSRWFQIAGIAVLSLPATLVKLLQKLPSMEKVVWLTADAEGEEAVPVYNVGMSAIAASILRKADAGAVAQARRENYIEWVSEIERIQSNSASLSHSSVKPLLPNLPINCCPLYFPIVVQSPAQVKKYLADHDIECFNWWQHMHPAVDWSQFSMASNLKRSVVALPVHHKLTTGQVRLMAKRLEEALLGD